ncbi:MAG TPA: tRNA preQ1(34) S-adenosylmethionine ribosyltransferase-isomerase QueA [Longimicrobiales bacterium]|nr:tRNA preQ1(34) S-adenosylmethionine ribosyltransferase-isomerase QueA [Longimicrobiales bacterium]
MSSRADSPGAPELPTSAYDYDLPPGRIAAHPAGERDASRLLVVRRDRDTFEHRAFRDIVEYFEPGDVLVLNETRVIPARLLGTRERGGTAEIVLLHPLHEGAAGAEWPTEWTALVRPGSKLRDGRRITVSGELAVEIVQVLPDGTRHVRLHTPLPVRDAVQMYGRMPLPPYIERDVEPADAERYQTVYARAEGSVAAPTAGLHFTPALIEALEAKGVYVVRVVLHVGVGTFRPVEVEDPAAHEMHAEWYEVTPAAAAAIDAARAAGGRVWAVGTTVARTLETVVGEDGCIAAGSGWTRLFIRPGYEFRAVDALITNFHLPRSTLLMLVSAFAGHDRTMAAYRTAVAEDYRFYSYGDAMVIP